MGKSKVNRKITINDNFSAEGTLDVDALQENTIMCEVEDEGSVDLLQYLQAFNGKYVKITITNKTEEIPEE